MRAAGGVRPRRPDLPRQEAGALVPGPQHRAGRGRDRVRGPHLAVDLRAAGRCRWAGRRRARARADKPAALVIWTTTPWTLPANLAVVANPELEYVALPVRARGEIEYLLVAKGLAETFLTACGLDCRPSAWVSGAEGGLLAAAEGAPLPADLPAAIRRRRGARGQRRRIPAVLRPPRHPGGRHRPGAHRPRTRRRRLRRRARAGPAHLRAGRRARPPDRATSRQWAGHAGVRGQPADRRRPGASAGCC